MMDYIETWEHSSHFSTREQEYLMLETIRVSHLPFDALEAESEVHRQLDEIWNQLKDFLPSERVVLMTRPSNHPSVITIIS